MATMRRTARFWIPVVVLLGGLALWYSLPSQANPGRFDRFTVHNLTDKQAQVVVTVKHAGGEVLYDFHVGPGQCGGYVLNSGLDVQWVRCTAGGKIRTVEGPPHLQSATFFYGLKNKGTTDKELCGEGLREDGKIVLDKRP